MGDVRPLDEARRRSFRRRSDRASSSSKAAPTFDVQIEGSRIYGRRDGSPAAAIERLRAGRLKPENRLDLHGTTEAAARERVFRFVRQSRASGLGCIALVHGRGLRSPAGPVLKQSVPSWLTELPLAHEVDAFASAPRELGGDGVTLVVLRPRGG